MLLLLFFCSTVFAKLDNPKDDYIFHEWFNNLEEYRSEKTSVRDVHAWVLSLNKDVDALRLRLVSGDEVVEVFGAQVDDGPRQLQPSTNRTQRKSRPAPKLDEKAMLSEIMRVINKFALTTQKDPEVDIDDRDNKRFTTIKLYFKGSQTCLVVRAEGRQWHYIIRHSLFPEWFYEEHEAERDVSGPYVDVPKSVTGEFYNALFHLLTMFFSFPV